MVLGDSILFLSTTPERLPKHEVWTLARRQRGEERKRRFNRAEMDGYHDAQKRYESALNDQQQDWNKNTQGKKSRSEDSGAFVSPLTLRIHFSLPERCHGST